MKENIRRAVSANVFLYRIMDEQIEYLLLKRVPRNDLNLPGFWQCVSGALEHGENSEMAARREVFEETAFTLEEVRSTGLTLKYPIKKEWRKLYGAEPSEVIEYVFVSRVQGDPSLSDEHSEFEWLPYQKAYQRLTFGDYQSVIETINSALHARHRINTSG
ncbi:NUDIX pyrophosphatase [Psychromonas sp.]|uniref:NUDIX hydrolase n=1 Tax=Psychromonas sp. TaxID=1884585 RepID=UPI00356280D8